MNKEEKEYKASIHEKSTEKLMSDLDYFGFDSYYGELGDICRNEITRRLELFDKLVNKEITVDEIPQYEEGLKRKAKINELIGDNETELAYDMIASSNYVIRYDDKKDRYQVYDTFSKGIVRGMDDVESVSEAVKCCVGDDILNSLLKEAAKEGVYGKVPHSGEEWREEILNPDLQKFIEGHKAEVSKILLMADMERLDTVSIDDISEKFKEAAKQEFFNQPFEEILE